MSTKPSKTQPTRPVWLSEFLAKALHLPPNALCVQPQHPVEGFDLLRVIWDPSFRPPAYSLKKPDWLLAMTAAFINDVACIDRKTQGRILEALGEIVQAPTTPRGDTIKPLTGDLRGKWRYRIGDYRLLYEPHVDQREVHLIGFTARGNTYD